MDEQQQETFAKIQHLITNFIREIDRLGLKSFVYVHDTPSVLRHWQSNFQPNDPAFYYLNQASNIDLTTKVEIDRWKHVITGTQQVFKVICINNIELESYLIAGKFYMVVSVLRAINGYVFVLTDEDGEHIMTPNQDSGFHSSRFELSTTMVSSN